MEILVAIILGLLVGIITGILPGLGITTSIIMTYVFLKSLDPISLFAFYLMLIIGVQYFGSVIGIYLGVPGEINSLVASKTGFRLRNKNLGPVSIGITALGSLFAGLIAVIIFYILSKQSMIVVPLLSVKVQAIVLFSVLVVMFLYPRNSKVSNLLLILFGLFLSIIGYNPSGISLTFNSDLLISGLDTALILLLLYVIPNLLQYYNQNFNFSTNKFDHEIISSVKIFLKELPAVLRGTFVGVFSGLIPGIGPIICSNIANSVEQKINKHKTIRQLVAAESANNSAIIIGLIPFIGLNLTIFPHEAVINNILINNGTIVNINWALKNFSNSLTILDMLVILAIVANIACFLISWFGSKFLIELYSSISYKKLVWITISVILLILLFQNYQSFTLEMSLLTILMLMPLTFFFIVKRIDTLPLVFAFLIGDQTISSFIFLKETLL